MYAMTPWFNFYEVIYHMEDIEGKSEHDNLPEGIYVEINDKGRGETGIEGS